MVPAVFSSTSDHPATRARGRRIVSCLTLSVVALFFLCGAVGLISWLSLHPRLPTVRVDSLSVSGFNLSASRSSVAKYVIMLNVTNPNRKIDLSMDHLGLMVMYKGATLSKKAIDFNPNVLILRERYSELKFEMETAMTTPGMFRKKTVGDLGWDWSKGLVTFNLRMTIGMNFLSGWLSKQMALNVLCRNLNVEFGSNGKDAGMLQTGRNTCKVDFD